MEALVRTLSKMFLVLVLLFGSPPGATLRERALRPAIALVMPLRRRGEGDDPLPWPEPWPPAVTTPKPGPLGTPCGATERVYIPVRAA